LLRHKSKKRGAIPLCVQIAKEGRRTDSIFLKKEEGKGREGIGEIFSWKGERSKRRPSSLTRVSMHVRRGKKSAKLPHYS